MNIYLKNDGVWLFPDEEQLGTAPYNGEEVMLNTVLDSKVGVQILVAANDSVTVTDISGGTPATINLLRAVTVNFNTAEELKGFGNKAFVYPVTPEKLPPHCTRRAPFEVYDAYKPYCDEQPVDGKIAFYITFSSNTPGEFCKKILIKSGDEERIVSVKLKVYNVNLPTERKLELTNWFSFNNMATFHGAEPYSEKHMEMARKYADAMLYMHQTHFLVTADYVDCSEENGQYRFDLSRVEQIAKLFFGKGFKHMEFGSIGTRKRVYHEDLNVLGFDGLVCDTEEGLKALDVFFCEMAKMAERNGWMDKIVFHIADEPDEPESAIPRRMKQYGAIHSLMREYFPSAKVCEAVKTAKFKDYIDILVPLSKTYEDSSEEFIAAAKEGSTIWFYTCCVPTGNYYQRFLDIPLASGRMLFWVAAKHNLPGYLHWGLNQMEEDQHPFEQTNQYHTYGDGVCLPAGDSHIVYPDGDDLYYSIRMETLRKGVDDYELLNLLKNENSDAYTDIMSAFDNNFHGWIDEKAFDSAKLNLLKALEK